MNHVVIIGAGQAGAQTLISLRQAGFIGDISLIGDEKELPYQRPPLSKKFLSGDMRAERLYFRPQDFYEKEKITLYLNHRAEKIDPSHKRVILDNGKCLHYNHLVLATGSRPRILPFLDTNFHHVFNIRRISDIEAMKPSFIKDKKLIIIGGGYIGLETAAVAQKAGLKTTIIEAADRVLSRVTDPIISKFYERIHTEEGVTLLMGTSISGLVGNTDITDVQLSDGRLLTTDIVVTGVGIVPNIELAEEAGLEVNNGIVVDEFACSSHPFIYAAGDCTYHPNILLKKNLRLESVQNAIEQGKTIASHIMGQPKPYSEIPWFWSDQYDVKLQIVGLSGEHDKIVLRGDDATRSFAVFYFKGQQLIAVDAINRPAEFMVSKQLIRLAAEKDVKINPNSLADETISPKELMKQI